MKKIVFIFLLSTIYSGNLLCQRVSPYAWDWKEDGPLLGVSLGGTAAGFLIIQNKEGFTEAEIINLQKNQVNINFIDRWVAGNASESASNLSKIPFYASFLAPAVLFFDDETNDHTGQVLGMYVESMATTATLFTITAGLTNRARPYVYNVDLDLKEKLESKATRSFYSGHMASTATATFFAAKIYNDFNPNSPAIPYLWAGAAFIPAAVGYLRLEAGQHFLSDVVLGYVLGAAVGYFIPEFHKKKNRDIELGLIDNLDF